MSDVYSSISIADLKTVSGYLNCYAENFLSGLQLPVLAVFDSVVVVPIYDESFEQIEAFLEFRRQAERSAKCLFIFVFNAPNGDVERDALLRTRQVFLSVLHHTQARLIGAHVYFSQRNENQSSLSICLINRCDDERIPPKQGVGLARKLGMDLALYFIYEQYKQSGSWCKWIHSTDADVILPKGYADLSENIQAAACIYPFKHQAVQGYEAAIDVYEFSLRYYVERLAWAGSPYAFHTIGSLVAVSSVAYAQVRGVPKRAGAEDFYLLNKVAKLGKVVSLDLPEIKVAGRPSQRVPFGTGPALIKMRQQEGREESFLFYHPRIFTLLKYLLLNVSHLEQSNAKQGLLFLLQEDKLVSAKELSVMCNVLHLLGWQKQYADLQKRKSSETMQQAFHTWFDAFITLRFIHELRDRLYSSVPLLDLPTLLKEQNERQPNRKQHDRGIQIDYLAWFKTLGV